MSVAGAGTLTAHLRELLLKDGNKLTKISALYDRLRQGPFASVTKTHIKRKIIHGMVLRDEVRERSPCCFLTFYEIRCLLRILSGYPHAY